MKRSVLFFVPTNPYPPRYGAHWRYLSMLGALKRLGLPVTLAGTTLLPDAAWTAAGIARLRGSWVDDVRIYEPTPADLLHIGRVQRNYVNSRSARQVEHKTHAIFSSALDLSRARDMHAWFGRLYDDLRPNILCMSHTIYDGLVDHQRTHEAIRIMDTHDLWSLNLGMQYALARYFRGATLDPWSISDEVLHEDFVRDLGLAASEEEFQVVDRYDHTIAISGAEARIIREHTAHTTVVQIPMMFDPYQHENHYSGAALFPAAPNIFNMQGIIYFIKKALPLVRDQVPDFSLLVTGNVDERVRSCPVPNVTFAGFLPELTPAFEQGRFVICPLLSGTGQKVKIVEAMAHGLPVVATACAAEGSPIQHGRNGLVAATTHEFAEHVARLWADRDLCRQLGGAARATIAQRFSGTQLTEQLRPLVT